MHVNHCNVIMAYNTVSLRQSSRSELSIESCYYTEKREREKSVCHVKSIVRNIWKLQILWRIVKNHFLLYLNFTKFVALNSSSRFCQLVTVQNTASCNSVLSSISCTSVVSSVSPIVWFQNFEYFSNCVCSYHFLILLLQHFLDERKSKSRIHI